MLPPVLVKPDTPIEPPVEGLIPPTMLVKPYTPVEPPVEVLALPPEDFSTDGETV